MEGWGVNKGFGDSLAFAPHPKSLSPGRGTFSSPFSLGRRGQGMRGKGYGNEMLLVIELDGGIHNGQDIKESDENRQVEIERFDLYVLRFKNEEVLEDVEGVLEEVREFA